MRQAGPFLLMVAIAVGVVAYLRPSSFRTLLTLASNWEKAARSMANAQDATSSPRNADDALDDEPRFPGEPVRRRNRPIADWQDDRQDNGTRAERRPSRSDDAPPPRRNSIDSDSPRARRDERSYGWQPTTRDGQPQSAAAPTQRRSSWPEERAPRDDDARADRIADARRGRDFDARADRRPERDNDPEDGAAERPRDLGPPPRSRDRQNLSNEATDRRRDDAADDRELDLSPPRRAPVERRDEDAPRDSKPRRDDAWRPAGEPDRPSDGDGPVPPRGMKRFTEEGVLDRESPARRNPPAADRDPIDGRERVDNRDATGDRRDAPPRNTPPADPSPRRSRWQDSDDLAMRPIRENPPMDGAPAGIGRSQDVPARTQPPDNPAPRGREDDAPTAPPARPVETDRPAPASPSDDSNLRNSAPSVGLSAGAAASPSRKAASSNPWDRPEMPDSPIAGGPIAGRQIDELESSRILAKVGPEAILARDCMFAMAKDRVFGVAQFREEAIRQKAPPEAVQPQIDAFMKRQLKGRIDTKLLVLDAKRKLKKEQMSHIQREVAKMFDNEVLPKLMKEAKLGSQRELDAYLASQSTTLELCRQYFGEIIMSQQWLREQVKPNESIGHNDMLAYYRAHLAEMELSPSRARWEQLTLLKATPNARAKLAAMGNRVLDGAPLAEVAKAESQGPGAASGGQQGWVKRGSLVSTTIDKAIFSLPVGQLSPILEDDEGFHIVRVVQREESSLKPFEDAKVQSEIRTKIKDQRASEAREAYLVKLRAQIPVWTVYDNPDTAPPDAAAGALGGRNRNRPM